MSMHERAVPNSFIGEGGFSKEKLPPVPSVIKEIRTTVDEEYIDTILTWAADRETSLHLDPPLINPDDIFNSDALGEARQKLREYYASPNILPFFAFDHNDKPVGILSMRPDGDAYIKNQSKYRTPILERLIVDPRKRRERIGADLSASAISYMFKNYKGYRDSLGKARGAAEIYAWAMQRGEWHKNLVFFQELGFEPKGSWKHFARTNGHENDYVDNAFFFTLKPTWFAKALDEKPRNVIIPLNHHESIADNATLGNEHFS